MGDAKLAAARFADSVGLKADFFGYALLSLTADLWRINMQHVESNRNGERPYKRNIDAVRSIASGTTKISFRRGSFRSAIQRTTV